MYQRTVEAHLDRLRERGLLREACLIDGQWITGDAGRVAVHDPASGEAIASVPDVGASGARRAVDASSRALPGWRGTTARERGAVLERWHDLMLKHREDLATLLTLEEGKPLAEARAEIAYGASFLSWFAAEGRRTYGDLIPANERDRRLMVAQAPIGVTAAITPWNFPVSCVTRKIAPALAAGCTQVLKPAPETPLSALALAELATRAGLPAGVLNVITGDAPSIGAVLTADPAVRMLTFTGSTEVGKLLLRQCADTVKKVGLELGGNAPFIVFEDADLDATVSGLMASKFRNTGQTCICANRIFVHHRIHEEFAGRLKRAVEALQVAPGIEDGAEQGPLINEAGLDKVLQHVDDALRRGARVLVGGKRHPLGGTYYTPTVLERANDDMQLAAEETFGPVAPLFQFESEAEVVARANATPSGLAAYFYTRDLSRAWRVQEALEFGIIGVNTGLVSNEIAPFGGIKESGLGREGSRYGIEEFLEKRYVAIGVTAA
jgi:succinate-semialdehyde dehydrogenase / glutarate-semialdehyde dehydrogenase